MTEVDLRHLYQPDAQGGPSSGVSEAPPSHTNFSIKERLAAEAEAAKKGNYDEDWLPEGHSSGAKKGGSGAKKRSKK